MRPTGALTILSFTDNLVSLRPIERHPCRNKVKNIQPSPQFPTASRQSHQPNRAVFVVPFPAPHSPDLHRLVLHRINPQKGMVTLIALQQ